MEEHPIKANPVKTGDAKPWVYRHISGQDCQATEDRKSSALRSFGLAYTSQVF